MKRAAISAFACLILLSLLPAEEGAASPAGIVEDLKIDLASPKRSGAWIFDKVASRRDVEALGESRFEDWTEDYSLYIDAVVEKAKELGLHDPSLEAVMKAISADFNEEGEVGYVPVAAFKALRHGKAV